MPEDFTHVQAGEPVRISGPTWNAVLDTAKAYRRRDFASSMKVGEEPWGNLVRVVNNSGSDVGQFGVIGYGTFGGGNTNSFGPGILPSAGLAEFQKRFIINGTTPDISNMRGQYVVTLDPIANGKIGRGFLYGACPAYVNINTGGDQFAELKNGDLTQLDSLPAGGSARILWRDSSGTGSKWCWVMLGQPVQQATAIFFTLDGTLLSSDATTAVHQVRYSGGYDPGLSAGGTIGNPYGWSGPSGAVGAATYDPDSGNGYTIIAIKQTLGTSFDVKLDPSGTKTLQLWGIFGG